MGGGASTPAGNLTDEQEKQPTAEEVLIKNLVTKVPSHLNKISNEKREFVSFARHTWLSQREITLDALEETENVLRKHQGTSKLITCLNIASTISRALLLSYLFWFNEAFLAVGLVLSLTIDYFFHKLSEKSSEVKLNMQALIPVFVSDKKDAEKAKQLWCRFQSCVNKLKDEVDDFVRTSNYGFSVLEGEAPGVARFLNRVRNVKSENKEDMRTFFHAYLELIHDYNSGKRILRSTGSSSTIKKADEMFYKKCTNVGSEVSGFTDDLALYYAEIEFVDFTRLALELILKNSDSSRELERLRKCLEKERDVVQKSISGVLLKG